MAQLQLQVYVEVQLWLQVQIQVLLHMCNVLVMPGSLHTCLITCSSATFQP